MTVKELIVKLTDSNQNAEVYYDTNNEELLIEEIYYDDINNMLILS